MNHERSSVPRRPPPKERPQAEARLDRDHALKELTRFLDLVGRDMGLDLKYEVSTMPGADASPDHNDIVVEFSGADKDLLLERNAKLLLALEYIGHRWLRLDPRLHDSVRFDCDGYRVARLEELKLSARVAAQRVRETGQVFRFNPMSPRERRIVHLELSGAADVRTVSEGSGDHRQLVIYPAGKK